MPEIAIIGGQDDSASRVEDLAEESAEALADAVGAAEDTRQIVDELSEDTSEWQSKMTVDIAQLAGQMEKMRTELANQATITAEELRLIRQILESPPIPQPAPNPEPEPLELPIVESIAEPASDAGESRDSPRRTRPPWIGRTESPPA